MPPSWHVQRCEQSIVLKLTDINFQTEMTRVLIESWELSHIFVPNREKTHIEKKIIFFLFKLVYIDLLYIEFLSVMKKKKKKLIIYWDEQYVTMNLILEMKPEVPDFHQICNYFKINITLCSTYKYYNLQMNI